MPEINSPIGIFDSGIGGLTVAKAITQALPHESFIYFGDTAHLPYGEKSAAAIQAYSIKIVDFFLKHKVKAVVIACNSASAAAYKLVKEYVGSKALVLNVIDPVVEMVGRNHAGKKVGLIGTNRTIQSNTYRRKIDRLNLDIELYSKATPLLASMIEEGFINNKVSKSIIEEYLKDQGFAQISSIILGCTHYPLVSAEISDFFGENVEIIDSSKIVAQAVKSTLQANHLLNLADAQPIYKFYVSDLTDTFTKSAQRFFGRAIDLEYYPIWD